MHSQTIVTINWLKHMGKAVLTVLIVVLLLRYALAATNWNELNSGLEYQDLSTSYYNPWSHIHVFRVSLNENQLSLVMAKDLDVKNASVNEFAQHSSALISINGGFFDQSYHPLGLRIQNKQQQNPLKHISWWGVFYIKNNKPFIASPYAFNRDKQIEFAIQSGPRLLVNGQVPPLKPGRAERTALGITKKGEIIILITNNTPLSTMELAQLMKAPPLNCYNALNLDGGSSTQLHANINSFHLNVHGYSNVSDSVIVKSKQ